MVRFPPIKYALHITNIGFSRDMLSLPFSFSCNVLNLERECVNTDTHKREDKEKRVSTRYWFVEVIS